MSNTILTKKLKQAVKSSERLAISLKEARDAITTDGGLYPTLLHAGEIVKSLHKLLEHAVEHEQIYPER